MVKVIWQKAHRRRRRMVQSCSPGGCNVSSYEGTLAPHGEYDWTCASFGPLESTTQTANRSVQPFLHNSRQKLPIHYNGRTYPPELPLPWGSGPYVIHSSLGPPDCWTQMATRSLQPFLQGSLVWQQTDRETDRQTDRPLYSVGNTSLIGRMYLYTYEVVMRNLCVIRQSHTLVSC